MRFFLKVCLNLVLGSWVLWAQDRGAWIDYDLGVEYSYDYLQGVGSNCLIYYPSVQADSVLAFDIYSHQWHAYPFTNSEWAANVYAGENGAMVWNDSVLILFDAIHSAFHELDFDGEMLHTGTTPYNLPGSVGSLSYILTTEKMYVFDHDNQTWAVYAYTQPGFGTSFGYSGNGKKDYVMIAVTNQSTSEVKLIAYSKSRGVFEEISSVNLEWNILDHGFACWVNGGIPESDYFFTAYSAENGFLEKVEPNRSFDPIINGNDPIAESTVFMATYYIPHDPGPGGVRYNYAADTRHGSFWNNHFEEGSDCANDWLNTGFRAAVLTTKNSSTYEILSYFYNGDINDLITIGKSVLHANEAEHGFYAGSSYFTGYDTYHFIFENMLTMHQHTIELPAPTEGYGNPTIFRINADWGIAMCQRALTNTISIYSFNTHTDSVQTIVEPVYTYDFEKMKSKYYYYGSSAYNDAKKILVYAPTLDTWTTLPLASDGKWFFGEDFVCTYDKNDGNLKIHDVPANHELAFPLGWQSTYDFDRHTYGKEKFYIASNTDGHYFGFSSYTRDIKETVAEYYYSTNSAPLNGMVAIMYNASDPKDFLAYNALSNSFVPLQLSDEQGDYRNVWAGDSTMLVTTQHGHLLAFDPYVEATAIKEGGGDKNNTIPGTFALKQNYPNPFNPTTVISYFVGAQNAAPLQVQLVIYNSLGQKVATLVNAKQNPGVYSVTFDASGLASGIYFYRLTAGLFVQYKKMILLR